VAHVERSGADLHRGDRHRGRAAAAGVIVYRGRGCFYLMNSHHTAKAAVAKMAVMAIEINNESAANLIQAITVHNFQSAPLPGVPVVS
jgi:hypothetical protein